jgi:large subunit ribosomal protein L18
MAFFLLAVASAQRFYVQSPGLRSAPAGSAATPAFPAYEYETVRATPATEWTDLALPCAAGTLLGLAAVSMSKRHARHESVSMKHNDYFMRQERAENGRLRLCVFRSNNHIYGQVIDDRKGAVMVAASTLEKTLREAGTGGNKDAAQAVGKLLAERAIAKGVSKVFFDRNGRPYHGRIAALADGAREGGLVF